MKNLPIVIFCYSLFIIGNSCSNETNVEKTKTTLEITEQKDTVLITEDSIPLEEEYNFDSLLNDLVEITFEPRLYENIEDAEEYFDEKGIAYDNIFSPEETMSTIWVILETTDKKNHLELSYHYFDENGHFINFRNIISKIEFQYREKTLEELNKIAEKHTNLKGKKFKKEYGANGMVYFEPGVSPARQIIVSSEGGSTDWIEIRQCDYFFVSENELLH
jgi:hypothetical protein